MLLCNGLLFEDLVHRAELRKDRGANQIRVGGLLEFGLEDVLVLVNLVV